MTTWNPSKDPRTFPASWHDIIRQGPGAYRLCVEETEAKARKVMYKFNAFKASLRFHPPHPTARALRDRKITLGLKPAPGGIGVWVGVKWAESWCDKLRETIL